MNKELFNPNELLIKTIGLMETLPERISKLESRLNELEMDYREFKVTGNLKCSNHQEFLKQEIDTMKKEIALLESIAKSLTDTDTVYGSRFEILEQDYKKREQKEKEYNEEVKGYRLTAINKSISLLVVSLAIVFFVWIGVPKQYMPWSGPTQIETIAETQTLIRIHLQTNGSINESDLKTIIKRYPHNFSHDLRKSDKEYYFIDQEYLQLINNTRQTGTRMKINKGL